jgi:hypothetical protein
MPLSFVTQNQQFIFADQNTHRIVNPANTQRRTEYNVYVVVRNTNDKPHANLQARVWLTGFGIGEVESDSGITQPTEVTVPAAAYGNPGQATVLFTFIPQTSGLGCLHIQLTPNGPTICQHVSVRAAFERERAQKTGFEGMQFASANARSCNETRFLAVSLES